MGKLLAKDKEVVVPGETLAEGMDHLPGPGTYRDGDKILASKIGLTTIDGRAIKLIPSLMFLFSRIICCRTGIIEVVKLSLKLMIPSIEGPRYVISYLIQV